MGWEGKKKNGGGKKNRRRHKRGNLGGPLLGQDAQEEQPSHGYDSRLKVYLFQRGAGGKRVQPQGGGEKTKILMSMETKKQAFNWTTHLHGPVPGGQKKAESGKSGERRGADWPKK